MIKRFFDFLVISLLIINLVLISWAPVKLLTGFSAVVFAVYIIICLFERKIKVNIVDLGVIVFTLSIIVSCLFSINPRESFSYFEKLILKPVVLYFTIRSTALTDKIMKVFFFSVVLSYSIFLLCSLKNGISNGFCKLRFTGGFKKATRFSKLLDLMFMLFIGEFSKRINFIYMFVLYVFSIMCLTFIILSGTRGAWFSISVVFLSFLIMRLIGWINFSYRRLVLILLVPLFSITSVYFVNKHCSNRASFLKKRIKSLVEIKTAVKKDYSLQQRLKFYRTALVLFRKRPITGWGFGRKTPKLVVKKLGYEWFTRKGLLPFRYHAHNTFLEILFECGVVGFAGYCFLLFAFFWLFVKMLKEGQISVIKISLFLSICTILIHSLVTYYFQTPIIYMFFVHLGLFSAKVSL